MRGLAEEELSRLKTQLAEAEANLRLALLPRDAADEKGAILDIRPEPAATSFAFRGRPVPHVSKIRRKARMDA